MGFWNGLVKVAQGKPVFEAAEESEKVGEQVSSVTKTASSGANPTGNKIIPEVQIEHCKSHTNGTDMEVTVWITNQSAVEIELDKIIMLGTTTEIDRILAPNEGREIRLYKGQVAKSDDNEMARLQYKQRDNGDYFQADFTIEFNYTSQGFYEVEEMHPVKQIRDI